MSSARFAWDWDRAGQALSALCIVHCVALPLVLGFLPSAAAELLEGEAVHRGLLAFVAATALAAFVPGVRRHRRGSVLVLAAVALGLLASAGFLLPEDGSGLTEVLETGLTLGGGVLLASAHWRNRTLCRACCEPAARPAPAA
ncbi:MerC domain-containing protein [Hyalangium gracile]|uniref:MerC domain-containing protein n=1 Tax=Hyalangium gracile TaxID=394092 RepID=UPI001CCFA211|nr:MerC domain-containing protein [Hyalangium gracile]